MTRRVEHRLRKLESAQVRSAGGGSLVVIIGWSGETAAEAEQRHFEIWPQDQVDGRLVVTFVGPGEGRRV